MTFHRVIATLSKNNTHTHDAADVKIELIFPTTTTTATTNEQEDNNNNNNNNNTIEGRNRCAFDSATLSNSVAVCSSSSCKY